VLTQVTALQESPVHLFVCFACTRSWAAKHDAAVRKGCWYASNAVYLVLDCSPLLIMHADEDAASTLTWGVCHQVCEEPPTIQLSSAPPPLPLMSSSWPSHPHLVCLAHIAQPFSLPALLLCHPPGV
jgi:hypothetical protein